MKTLSLAVTTTFTFILSIAAPALAQGVGGFSAGPGLAPAQEHSVPAAAPPATTPPATSPPATTTAPPVEQAAPPAQTPEEINDEDQGYETRVISYKKSPVFTQQRQFGNARLWVLDPGYFIVEQWWTGEFGTPSGAPAGEKAGQGHRFQTEIEMGVAKHVQVDIYLNYEFATDANGGNWQIAPGGHTGVAAEVRVALPDYYGQVFMNPTLYFEVTSQYYNSPRVETRLLLGGTMFTPRLLGVVNFAFERNIFRDSTSGIDYEIKSEWGANYDIIPGWFRAGAQATFGWDGHGTIDANGYSQIFPVAQIGPQFLFSLPNQYFRLLGSFVFGLAPQDAPYTAQLIASCTF